jgi:hypothetical protein
MKFCIKKQNYEGFFYNFAFLPSALKKKFWSILLILCLMLPATGTIIYLHFQKKQVKKSVKKQIIAGIDKNALVLLKFSSEDIKALLRWEHSREFEYNGQMYDVIETVYRNDSVYYWCWWDYEETLLNKKLNKLTCIAFGKDPGQKEKQHQLISFYKSLFFSDSGFELKIFSTAGILNFNFSNRILKVCFPPPIPPPKSS